MAIPPPCQIPIPQQVQYIMEEFSEITVTGKNPDKSCKKIGRKIPWTLLAHEIFRL